MTLTPKAERVAALLAAEWRATEAAITELEAELPYSLTQVAGDIRAALARRSFHARITDHLPAEGPATLRPAGRSGVPGLPEE